MLHNRLRGRDLHAPSNELVENNTGSLIPKLKVVRLTGQGVQYPTIALGDAPTHLNFGVTYDSIPAGKSGTIAVFGFMFEVDTSAWAPFTILYSDNMGNLSTIQNGGVVGQVINQDTEFGIIYVTTEANTGVNAISWRLTGNSDLNPAINFLGTQDEVPLLFRTNNLQRMVVDEDGKLGLGPDLLDPLNHFHQKSHLGFANSGLRQETFSLTTQSSVPEPLIGVPINQNSVVRVTVNVIARASDGSARAAFERTGLFYRENSNVMAQRVWQTTFTDKSDNAFDIGYTMSVGQLSINVKSSTVTDTYWTGHIKIEALETDS